MCKVFFFLLRSVGRRDLSAGPEQKKNTSQGVFFLLRPRGKAGEGEARCWPGCFFFVVARFCSCPASLVSRKFFAVGPGCAKCFFFCCAPLGAATFRPCLSPGPEQKKKNTWVVFVFCSGPVPAPNGASPSLAFRRGRSKKKKHPGWCFFLLWPRAGKGLDQNNKHPGWCFFLLRPRADAHSLTAGLGGDASPSPGWCLFFLLRGGAGPGWCFFFCCGPARTLTHSLWAGAISARPGWCFFFLLRPRRVFLDNNKNVWGTTSGLKRPGGATAKKKHHWVVFFFCSGPVPVPNGASPSPAFPRGRSKKKTPGWCFFFCSGPVPAPNGASPSLAFRRGRSKKKHPGWCFFFCSGPVPARGFSFPCLSPGPEQKQKTPWVVFFFLLRPRADAHSLTAGLGGDASPSPGWCFFFLLWPRPDAHSLTVGWGDFGKARVVFCFCCGPAGSF